MKLIPYKPLLKYLERYTILKLGRLHVRLHVIKRSDITPFQHSHPFSYVSVIVKGGYIERIRNTYKHHNRWSIIVRRSTTPHRLVAVLPDTTTLFFTWRTKSNKWKFHDYGDFSPEWIDYTPGIYQRELYGHLNYSKFERYWYKSEKTVEAAELAVDPSIDQNTKGILVKLLTY